MYHSILLLIEDQRLYDIGIHKIMKWREDVFLYLWQGKKKVVKFAVGGVTSIVHSVVGETWPLLQGSVAEMPSFKSSSTDEKVWIMYANLSHPTAFSST